MENAVQKDSNYTYADYAGWPDHEKWEIIDGKAYDMAPAPRVKHQILVGNFFSRLKNDPRNPCFTGISPIDVVFDERNVVQPDVLLVCDKNKINEANIQGAPDLIAEVVSPSTEVKDRREKKALYESRGVFEYIILFPEREYAERYFSRNKKYGAPEIFNWDETLELRIFDLEINLREIFEKE